MADVTTKCLSLFTNQPGLRRRRCLNQRLFDNYSVTYFGWRMENKHKGRELSKLNTRGSGSDMESPAFSKCRPRVVLDLTWSRSHFPSAGRAW